MDWNAKSDDEASFKEGERVKVYKKYCHWFVGLHLRSCVMWLMFQVIYHRCRDRQERMDTLVVHWQTRVLLRRRFSTKLCCWGCWGRGGPDAFDGIIRCYCGRRGREG
jgi:hypothetical protein